MVPESTPPPPLQRRRVAFTGRVQGVGFRATSRSVASAHPVSGWVKNEADGTVLLEVQGAGDAIEAFLSDLRGRMDRLVARESALNIPLVADEARFEIRH